MSTKLGSVAKISDLCEQTFAYFSAELSASDRRLPHGHWTLDMNERSGFFQHKNSRLYICVRFKKTHYIRLLGFGPSGLLDFVLPAFVTEAVGPMQR